MADGKHNRGKIRIRHAKPEHADLTGLETLIRAVYGKRAQSGPRDWLH